MAYAINTYTGDGTTDTFSVTFPYISTTDVVVTIDGVTKTLTTDYTFATSSTIQFTSPPAGSTTIKFTRSSNRTARLVDYQDGSTITESILDQDSNQMFYMAQEAIDITEDNISKSAVTDQWDAESKRITNLATPTAATDASTKAYVDAVAGSASAAASSETAAANSATAAQNAQNAAEAALDTFDDDYLGSKSSDPSVDNDGDALADGSLYFNTTDNRMKVYDLGTTTWNYVSPSGADQTKINTVSDNITAVSNVSSNLSSVQNFDNVYRIASSAPVSSLDVGDLYFDTTANELKVYKSSGWAAAGSTVNGTAQRYNYTATAAQTTFTGADSNGNTLAYDAGYADVYLNGVRLSGADITITSGTSVVLAVGASAGDILDVVAYGTFNVASINAGNIDSGTIGTARLPKVIIGSWESKSANFTAVEGKGYFCNTSGGAIDVTLPASPTAGDTVRFVDEAATFDTNDLTILNGSSKIQGASANLDVATERAAFALVYCNSTQGWLLTEK